MTNITLNVPTAAKELLNEYQLRTVEDYGASLTEQERENVQEHLDALAHTTPPEEVATMIVENIVVPFNMMRFKNEIQGRIDEGDHTVIAVGPSETEPHFNYTVGLLPTTNVELFCSGIGGSTAARLLNIIADQFRENPDLDINQIDHLDEFKINSQPLRVCLVKRNLREMCETHTFKVKEFFEPKDDSALVVILLGDVNNALPGEEGYGLGFVQMFANGGEEVL